MDHTFAFLRMLRALDLALLVAMTVVALAGLPEKNA